jgi:N-acetyl-alpha-D-glucosaminyl L-malate synthase BshA
MKIGIVCYPTYGGSGVMATELGIALAQRGHVVHFITSDRPFRLGGFETNVFYHQVNPEEYPLFQFAPYETALASKIVDVVRYHGLDLLHVHYAIPHAASALMARHILQSQGHYLPFVTTLHGTDITLVGQEPAYEPVVRYTIDQSDGVTAVSEYLRGVTCEVFGVERPIDVVPNFIDTQRFTISESESLRRCMAPNNEKILIHISNFRPVKRVPDVYAIFERLLERLPVKLMMVGDGPERSGLERIVRQNGHAEHVTFVGKVDAVEKILPLTDLFLMPSASESFGLAALEAMACGVPVVASDAGGLPECVVHGQTGYLAPVRDVAAMADHAWQILQDDDTHCAFRKAAHAHAQHFSIEHTVPQYEAVYARTLARARQPAP